jgi:hypothetical protein
LLAGICFAAVSAESTAGVQWTPPHGWVSEGSAPMRAATYKVSPAPGDPMGGECVIYFFGAGQGGPVDANIERWKGQFTDASGHPAPAAVKRGTVHGMPMTTIDVSGTYSGLGGPMGSARAVPGYRLLGAIVEGPGGNLFVKFTGPAATIKAAQGPFAQMLESFQPVK